MKNDRLFQILYILLEKHSITAPELAKTLEVSVRTIYRDIDSLCVSGIPIYTTNGKGGGISLMEQYTFDKGLLSDEEQSQILFAVKSISSVNGQNEDKLLAKLGTMFQKGSADWLAVDFSRWGMKSQDTEKFATLKKAILEKIVIEIRYCGTSGITETRCIKPLRMIFKNKSWYIQAYCCKADDFRLFKLNRMIELSLTETRFIDEFAQLPPIDENNAPLPQSEQVPVLNDYMIEVELYFTSKIAYRVWDEFSIPDITRYEDGAVLVKTSLPNDSWLYGYLLSFGRDIRIIKPDVVKENLISMVKEIQTFYET